MTAPIRYALLHELVNSFVANKATAETDNTYAMLTSEEKQILLRMVNCALEEKIRRMEVAYETN